MVARHFGAETDLREPSVSQGLGGPHHSNKATEPLTFPIWWENLRQTRTLRLPSWVQRSSQFPPSGRQGGGSEPQWPAWHRCLRPARPVAPPQQTRRPLAGSSGHWEPQVPAGRRGWCARVPAGRSLSSQRPGPAPTWLNQARLCLADLNIWIPARPLPRPSRAGPLFHQRTPGTVPVGWDPDCFPKSDALAYAHQPNTRKG